METGMGKAAQIMQRGHKPKLHLKKHQQTSSVGAHHAMHQAWGRATGRTHGRIFTCNVKPQGGVGQLQGHHTHDLRHFVILHDGEVVERLIEEKRQSGGGGSTDPLDVQTSRGGLLRTAVVRCFYLKKKKKKTSRDYSLHGNTASKIPTRWFNFLTVRMS